MKTLTKPFLGCAIARFLIFIGFLMAFGATSCTKTHAVSNSKTTVDNLSYLEDSAYLEGIDVSHWNDYEKVRSISPAIIYAKVSQGSAHTDSGYKHYVKIAYDNDNLIGGYHYMNTDPIEKQFYNFYNHYQHGDLIPMLDIEKEVLKLSKDEVRHRVRTFADLCKKYYGHTPILYCCENFKKYYFNKGFEDCFWWADSKCKKPTIHCDIWQYNILNGIDRNKFYVDVRKLLL